MGSATSKSGGKRTRRRAADDYHKFTLLDESFAYEYAERTCHYRDEQLEMSPEEMVRIDRLIAAANETQTASVSGEAVASEAQCRLLDLWQSCKCATDVSTTVSKMYAASADASEHKCDGRSVAKATAVIIDSADGSRIDETKDDCCVMESSGILATTESSEIKRKSPMKVIIDTDIGTDVDDVLAILALLNMDDSDVQLLGVTTNYHPTLLRAHIVRRIFATADRNPRRIASLKKWSKVPVIAGSSKLCGTHREFFHAGNEGMGIGLSEEQLAELWAVHCDDTAETTESTLASSSLSAADFIFEMCSKFPKRVTIVSIGIPTNIGSAIDKYGDRLDAVCGHLVVMGGGSIITTAASQRGAIGIHKDRVVHLHLDASSAVGDCAKTEVEYMYKSKMTAKMQKKALEDFKYDIPKYAGVVFERIWKGQRQQRRQRLEDAETEIGDVDTHESIQPIFLFPNHNISGDTLASVLLFDGFKRTPVSVVAHDITKQHWLKGEAIETLLALSKEHRKHASIADIGTVETEEKRESDCYEYENGVCGALLREWFRIRRGQRGQCLHDPLTLYEAVYPLAAEDLEVGSQSADDAIWRSDAYAIEKESSLRYIWGTFVCHKWAAYLSFVPSANGPHRLAVRCKDADKLVHWCNDTLVAAVPTEKRTEFAGSFDDIF